MRDFIKQLITGKDNTSYDLARCGWILSSLTITVGSLWNAYHAKVFQLIDYAQSISTLAVAFGAAIFLKKDTEPNNQEKKD
jgi:hypothetical protein